MRSHLFATATAFLLGAGAAAQPFAFTRIVDNQTLMPEASPPRAFQGISGATLSGHRVSFEGLNSSFNGVYEWTNGALARVADSTTPMPGHGEAFVGLANGGNSGEHVVFTGVGDLVGGTFHRFNGQLGLVADNQMNAPNGGQFTTAGNPAVEGGSIAFFGRHRPAQTALPAVYRWDNSVISTVADTTTPVPGGTGTFQNLMSTSVRLNQSAVWFQGFDSANKTGIYRRNEQGLQAVIDTNTDGPAGEGKFLGVGLFGVDGEDILFNAGTVGNPVSALYQRINGQTTRILNSGDPAPGGGAFGTLQSFSLQDGVSVFYDNTNSVIYTNFGGTLKRIIGTGDVLDGKTISRVNFVPDGRDGNLVAFAATFTDHAPPVNYSQALYLVTIPAPGALLPFAGAALCALRRRR